ncbi:bifunctional ADP-dependent NAD(P)H-hydrate dehydratase/NAD(P)H-hydrate epimerase [Vibrio sonorensis]|uniref:bifunctional ADP-dependent NAD(P)H-hydrate dehydratase/NAD(P)H-hydrate epimerase n=1 Tax=Vibrio sonorensis TaxID=1004316 RepID=UPI0008DA0ED9|nr:bifunctional ADP-dependent NAD(P)H-hydrate dehydratase/NAD(P)H-hydrate epimerase [Vibrio sonorensis]
METTKGLYTAQQVKLGEINAAKACEISMYALMKRAGKAAYEYASNAYPHIKKWVILCGGGNNGGDGYVIAQLAKKAGISVSLVALVDPSKLTGDAATAKDEYLLHGGEVLSELDHIDGLIIDALLGTGLSGDVRESARAWISRVNESTSPVVSVDVPSGLCSDTGRVMGNAIVADHTVSFIGVKQGLVTGAGRGHCGKIEFAGLGVSQVFEQENQASANLLSKQLLVNKLNPRPKNSHKGKNGKALLIGGNKGMGGAIVLASEACARSGAGLTAALMAKESMMACLTRTPEVMSGDWSGGEALNHRVQWSDVLAIGPGLGRTEQSESRFEVAIELAKGKAKVVDADALWHLAQSPRWNAQWILTPHSGEAAMLLGCSAEEVENDRYKAVRQIQNQYGGICVLKGPGTLIADKDAVYVCPAGNAGMASGGMGDVLTGVIAAMLAQGQSLLDSALCGVLLHSMAADELAESEGQIGLLAGDLAPKIRELIKFYSESSGNNF